MLFPNPRWARDNRGEEHRGGDILVARTSGEHSQLEVEEEEEEDIAWAAFCGVISVEKRNDRAQI